MSVKIRVQDIEGSGKMIVEVISNGIPAKERR